MAGVGGKRRADGRLVAIHEVGATAAVDMEIDETRPDPGTAGIDRDGPTPVSYTTLTPPTKRER